MCTLIAENALQIDTCNGYALFLPVWLCCFIYDSLVWSVCFCRYGLVMLSSPRTLLLPNLSPRYSLLPSIPFVHAVFGVVGNLFFAFFYLYTYTIFFVGGV